MRDAELIGFLRGSAYYLAVSLGFSTKEQWTSSQNAGFITEDDWISALQKGYANSSSKTEIEEIGFSDIFVFRNELSTKLRKTRFRLNNLLSQMIEFDQLEETNLKAMNRFRNQIRKTHNECRLLIDQLVPFSGISSGLPELDKTLLSELERSEALLQKAKRIITE